MAPGAHLHDPEHAASRRRRLHELDEDQGPGVQPADPGLRRAHPVQATGQRSAARSGRQHGHSMARRSLSWLSSLRQCLHHLQRRGHHHGALPDEEAYREQMVGGEVGGDKGDSLVSAREAGGAGQVPRRRRGEGGARDSESSSEPETVPDQQEGPRRARLHAGLPAVRPHHAVRQCQARAQPLGPVSREDDPPDRSDGDRTTTVGTMERTRGPQHGRADRALRQGSSCRTRKRT